MAAALTLILTSMITTAVIQPKVSKSSHVVSFSLASIAQPCNFTPATEELLLDSALRNGGSCVVCVPAGPWPGVRIDDVEPPTFPGTIGSEGVGRHAGGSSLRQPLQRNACV